MDLYFLFSIFAWMILAIDVIIGLSAFLIFHLDL